MSVFLKRGAPTLLRAEVRLAAGLRHPAFRRAAFFDGSVAVFPWIEGAPPDALRREHVVDLLRALVRLHAHGFVHGDIKPANLIVGPEGAKLIDLGFAVPIGAAVVGGTPGFVAPELAAGEPASVASDLHALGATLRALNAEPELASRCLVEDPQRRPASAGSCLAMLGSAARPIDRTGGATEPPLPLPPLAAMTGRADDLAIATALDAWTLAGRATVELRIEAHGLTAFGAGRSGTLARRVAAMATSIPHTPVVVRGAASADADARDALEGLVRAAGAVGGTAWIFDADEALAQRLARAGATTSEFPRWSLEMAEREAAHWGVRAPIDRLHAQTGGQSAAIRRAIAQLAHDPAAHVGDRDWTREVPAALVPASLDAAREALEAGAPRRALALLERLDDAPRELRADALALAGELHAALAVEPEPIHADRKLARAQRLLRVGRFLEADAVAAGLDDPRALLVRAHVAREEGRMTDARALATQVGADGSGAVRREALLLEADLATHAGEHRSAVDLSTRALEAAEDDDDRSRAHARRAVALALGGRAGEALDDYRAALRLAESGGDLLALPAHTMNLATAHHARGDLGEALAGYERAGELARRLERPVTAVAADTNLAGLLASVGVRDEAADVLARAREVASSLGYAIYEAQCDLIEAESLAETEPRRGLELARRASQRFDAIGAARQATEATLLIAELAQRTGDDSPPLDEAALRRAGLFARLSRHRARRAFADGATEVAITLIEQALAEVDEDLIEEVAVRALRAEILAGSPSAEVARQEATRASDRLVATLPSGLRERARTLHMPPVSPSTRGLGEGGRRLVVLARRLLLEPDEGRVLAAALDEAVAITGAERGFLLRREPKGTKVVVARNLDRESIRRSDGRFSRSIAERVLERGESILTARASEDPDLPSRSIQTLGLRSVLCVPVHSPSGVAAALYLDHRFSEGTFAAAEREWVQALADLLGLALENARLHAAAATRTTELEREEAAARRQSEARAVEIARLSSALDRNAPSAQGGILGRSPALLQAIDLATRVAPSDLPVLIQGESGTGKELFARLVHDRSLRSAQPLLSLNCGALSAHLLESELFGHVRGAFTGATADHPGLFRSATGGTIFLDEVGEMPGPMQTRLLRVLQEGEVRPVGGVRSMSVDVRVIAATNRDLAREVDAGRFRQDLYFRLAGAELHLPPLRERAEDIPALASALLTKIAEEPGMTERRLSREALRALCLHAWPGNVRELEQHLRRAVLMATSETIAESDLFPQSRAVSRDPADRHALVDALAAAEGNKSRAARALGVSRVTLYRWLDRHAIPR